MWDHWNQTSRLVTNFMTVRLFTSEVALIFLEVSYEEDLSIEEEKVEE